jgi:hypothetical protein
MVAGVSRCIRMCPGSWGFKSPQPIERPWEVPDLQGLTARLAGLPMHSLRGRHSALQRRLTDTRGWQQQQTFRE